VLGFGVVAAVIPQLVNTTPMLQVGMATASFGLTIGAAIPGLEWVLDWRGGERELQENRLHYLLDIKG
jgi:hypothetical protein